MFDFNNIDIQVTEQEILSKVSEFDIFKKYCSNFIELDKSFCSDLRYDKNPDCRIYISTNNRLYYKDFSSGEHLSCFHYIMKKYNCTYYEALNIISTDFNIKKITYSKNIVPLGIIPKSINPIGVKIKSSIEIKSQPWTIYDYNYWNQYNINFEILDLYNVFSCKYIFLIKGDKRYITEYKNNNPVYAYRFTNLNKYSYKVYRPLEPNKQFKWLFSGGVSSDIEGYDQLPLNGKILVLTKSLKDCMCYYTLGIPAISLQGEANKLEQDLVDKLLKRFDLIIVNYDNDPPGIKATESLVNQYKFKHFYIDDEKDLSDYIKQFGIDKAKKLINKKLKICTQQ